MNPRFIEKKILNLLYEYSEKYHSSIQTVFQKFNWKWSTLSKFEIEAFFFSLLSFSICELKQNMDVIKSVQQYIFDVLLQKYNTHNGLGEIIEIRIKSYCKLKHDCINNNDNIELQMLERLLYYLNGVCATAKIEEAYPVVIIDFFQRTEVKSLMFPIHMNISGEFCCCLKHLFKENSDVRLLSHEKMDNLINDGKQEAKVLLSGLDLQGIARSINTSALIQAVLTKKKEWWQFWK